MYYEERVIDGILCSRSSPDSEFGPMGQRTLTAIILREREERRAQVIAEINNRIGLEDRAAGRDNAAERGT